MRCPPYASAYPQIHFKYLSCHDCLNSTACVSFVIIVYPLYHFLAKAYHSGKEITMTYGYIRVSSDRQTVENQRFEINRFCEGQKLKIDGWIEETISGTKNYSKRELGKLLMRVQKDD